MSTYLEEDRILFSCDWFGAHVAQTDLFVDGVDCILAEAKRYYAEIMMPFRKIVQKNLEKIKDLDIRLIAPSHGPIHRDPDKIVQAYRDWTDDRPRNSVVIPWVTMHGSTERLVWRLVDDLVERGHQRLPLQYGHGRHRPTGHGPGRRGDDRRGRPDRPCRAPSDGPRRGRAGQRPAAQGPVRLDRGLLRLGQPDGRRGQGRHAQPQG
ncbi:MAG: hypothetical protein MZU95_02085 [Desulfomicrobium escambiense]|nr:hypothetical protein [Desulfomicrobium escambiense]